MLQRIAAAGIAVFLAVPTNAATFDIIVDYIPGGQAVPAESNEANKGQTTEAFTARQIELFTAAEHFWETILTGFSGLTSPTYTLQAWMTKEDGYNGSLAYAGPNNNLLEQVGQKWRAAGGFMQFDADDFGAAVAVPQAEQLFLDSAVHEMGHALGFGTMFESNNLVDSTGNNYIGTLALAEYNKLNNTNVSSIVLENGGGHWAECWVEGVVNPPCDETTFNDPESMTPFAVDTPATFSPATIAAFQDMGYITADPETGFVIPLASSIGGGVSAVPLPASSLLLIGGLGGLVMARKKRKA